MKIKTKVLYMKISVVSITLIMIYVLYYNYRDMWISNVALGLGTGGVSSTIVAGLIDSANKRKRKEEEKQWFISLSSDFNYTCNNLLYDFVIAAQEIHGIDDEKRTFVQWVSMVLGNEELDECIIREADYALQQIDEMARQAERLLGVCKIHISNEHFDDMFVKKIRRIQGICQRIIREQKREKYNNCLSIISKELVNALNEYKDSFCEYKNIVLEDFNAPYGMEE